MADYNRDEEAVEAAIRYAESYYGTTYIFGGDDPVGGFDCSGFADEVMRSVGLSPFPNKPNAAQMFTFYARSGNSMPTVHPVRGALIFIKHHDAITHVEICLDDRFSISASGGDGTVDHPQDAINKNAFVKQRQIRRWSPEYELIFLDPFVEV